MTYIASRAGRLLIVLLLFAAGGWSVSPVLAQDQPSDDPPLEPWKKDVVARLSASQAAYSNWQEGGLNTFAVTTSLNGSLEGEEVAGWKQSYDARLILGVVKQDTLAFRKADDLIHLSASIQNAGSGFFDVYNPTVAVKVRTQFAPGFNYDKNPFDGEGPVPVKVSDFFAPAVFTETVGLTYEPQEWFTQRLGVAGKQTMVHIRRLRPLYGLEDSESSRLELGLESHTELDKEIFENVHVTSTLGLFAAFNKANVPDMMWESSVVMQVNEWLGVNLEFATLYDRDISRRIQFKEMFSLGFSFAMI